jgi:hypothetical protein
MGFDSPMKGKCYQARGKGWEATNTTQKLLHSRLPKKAIALMGSWPRNPGGTASRIVFRGQSSNLSIAYSVYCVLLTLVFGVK